jgi:hypothetical protein
MNKTKGGGVKESKQVVLYGNSIILGTIGASLKLCSGLEVTALPQKEPQLLGALNPDVLVFDLDATHPQEVLSLFANDPAMLLIGISPDVNLVQVWSARQIRKLSTPDLLDLIKNGTDLSAEQRIDANQVFRAT